MHRHLLVLLALAALVASAAAPASADFSFGSAARQAGMGGAGLALIENANKTAFLNPAALAYTGSHFRFPTFDWRYRGASLSDIISEAMSGGDLDPSEAEDWAREFASRETQFALTADLGLKVGPIEIAARGLGNAVVVPDPALQTWAAGGSSDDPTNDAYADIRAAAIYSLPSIGFAYKFDLMNKGKNVRQGELAIGARLNWLHSKYHEERVVYDSSQPDGYRRENLLDSDDSDWSLDLGTIFSPAQVPNLTVAAVVTNLRRASLAGVQQETVVDIGAAYRVKPVLIAADWRNITGAYGEAAQLNAGAEFSPVKGLALRAGFSSRGAGISYGASIFGIDIALTGERTFDAATTLHF